MTAQFVSDGLELVPLTLREANAFIAQHHRHHKPARGCRFVVGCARAADVVGCAIVGRPKARMLQDGWTAEITRCCSIDVPPENQPLQSNGKPHASGACALLYGACWRAARAIGYRRLVTYTLPSEGGGFASWCRLDADRRSRRRLVVTSRAATRRRASDAGQVPLGAFSMSFSVDGRPVNR
jgi:hypothetical protein